MGFLAPLRTVLNDLIRGRQKWSKIDDFGPPQVLKSWIDHGHPMISEGRTPSDPLGPHGFS